MRCRVHKIDGFKDQAGVMDKADPYVKSVSLSVHLASMAYEYESLLRERLAYEYARETSLMVASIE